MICHPTRHGVGVNPCAQRRRPGVPPMAHPPCSPLFGEGGPGQLARSVVGPFTVVTQLGAQFPQTLKWNESGQGRDQRLSARHGR